MYLPKFNNDSEMKPHLDFPCNGNLEVRANIQDSVPISTAC